MLHRQLNVTVKTTLERQLKDKRGGAGVGVGVGSDLKSEMAVFNV